MTVTLTPATTEYLRTIRPHYHDILEIDLSTVRINELFNRSGNFILIDSITGTGHNTIRINDITGREININVERRLLFPFFRFFLSNSAQAGARVVLVVGKSVYFDVEKQITLVRPVNRDDILINELFDYTHRLISGALTADGVQFSPTATTAAINTDIEVFNITVNPNPGTTGTILWVEFGLTIALRALFSGFPTWTASTAFTLGTRIVPPTHNNRIYECTTAGTSGTVAPTWPTAEGATVTDGTVVWTTRFIRNTCQWQARNSGGTWVNLHDAIIEAPSTNVFTNHSRSGYFAIVPHFNSVPFDIRVLLQCNTLNQGQARVLSNSFVRVIFR